ncbi:MAG: alpha/beta hydrolase, partial [Synechococcus sp.]
ISELPEILPRPLPAEPRVVSTIVYDTIGAQLLRRLGGLFWGGTPDSNFKALRSALVLAAYDEEGLTILNVIRKYPLRDLRLNLDPALTAASDLQDILVDSKRIFAYVNQQAATGVLSREEFLANLPDPRQAGSLEWSKTTLRITNPERDAGDTVSVDLYVPDNHTSSAPLVVISHGMASTRNTFSYLAEHLASQGMVVAAIGHPTSDALRYQQYIAGFAEEPDPRLALHRPLDITALLNELERNPTWQDRIQTDRVGVIGQSLGGYTVLASGGATLDFEHLERSCRDFEQSILPFNLSWLLQCQVLRLPEQEYQLRDERVAAILAINPIGSALFGPDGFSQIQIPVMMVAGTNDFFAPAVSEQIVPFTWMETDDRYLMVVENGTHFSFLPGDSDGEDVFNLPDILLGPDPQLAHPGMKALATIFMQTYLAENEEYRPYLTEFSISTPDGGEFNFALTTSLTEAELTVVE